MLLERQIECALDTEVSRNNRQVRLQKGAGKGADIKVNSGSEEEKYLIWARCKRQEWAVLGKHLGLFALCDWSLAGFTPENPVLQACHCQLQITLALGNLNR